MIGIADIWYKNIVLSNINICETNFILSSLSCTAFRDIMRDEQICIFEISWLIRVSAKPCRI